MWSFCIQCRGRRTLLTSESPSFSRLYGQLAIKISWVWPIFKEELSEWRGVCAGGMGQTGGKRMIFSLTHCLGWANAEASEPRPPTCCTRPPAAPVSSASLQHLSGTPCGRALSLPGMTVFCPLSWHPSLVNVPVNGFRSLLRICITHWTSEITTNQN